MRCLFPLGLPCHTSGVCLVQWQLSFGLAVIHQNTSKPFKGNGPKALQQGSPTERLLFSMFLKYRFYIHFPVSLSYYPVLCFYLGILLTFQQI